MPVDGAIAMTELMDNPLRFLRTHRVITVGRIPVTGTNWIWFGDDRADFDGSSSFAFAMERNLLCGVPLAVQVFGVGVIAEEGLDCTALPAVPIEDGTLCICTAPITGCCIVVQPEGAGDGPFLAHVQPTAATNDRAMRFECELAQKARFAGRNAPTYAYGRSSCPPPYAGSIIGLRVERRWRLFAQPFCIDGIHYGLGEPIELPI